MAILTTTLDLMNTTMNGMSIMVVGLTNCHCKIDFPQFY